MAKKTPHTPARSTKPTAPIKKTHRPSVRVNNTMKPRRLKRPQYKSLRLSKRINNPVRLPSTWQLTGQTTRILWQHKGLFLGLTIVYGIFNFMFVQGFSGGMDLSTLKTTLQEAFGGSSLSSSVTIFGVLVSSSGSATSASGSGYQIFLLLIMSLAVIWALRETMTGARIRIRDAYYRGMYPLIPFILVLCVICLQLVPLAIGASIYNIVLSNGIAVYVVEKILWAMIFGLLMLLSFYMISSSLFALYIVTLPDMTPMQALRSARELVRYRRWTVLRKILLLPVILLVTAAVIMLPIILFLTPLAQPVYYLLTMFAVVVIHTYLYILYRELLHE